MTNITEPLGVSFTTPGLIDLRAFTMFGVNSKPLTDNPIGYFGTGLKYALAVLLRRGHEVVIWIGTTRYEFVPTEGKFRKDDFVFIDMRKSYGLMKRFTVSRLPFTTELGKNWELWQAFRELETNTRDEGGTTDYIFQDVRKWEDASKSANRTVILVGGQKFIDVYNNRDEIFLNKDNPTLTLRFADPRNGVEVYNSPSRHVYYRGMRVYDLPKDKVSKYTYNFTRHMDLTEDRTLKYSFYMFMYLASVTIQSTDREFIRAIVGSDKDSFENEFSFDSSYATPSEEFKQVMASKKGGYLSGVTSFYGRYAPPPPRKKRKRSRSSVHYELVNNIADYLDLYDVDESSVSKASAVALLNECYTLLIGREQDESVPIEDPPIEDPDDPNDPEEVNRDEVLENALEQVGIGSDEEVPF